MFINRNEMQKLVTSYDSKSVTIGVLGSHSAEEVGVSAKLMGFPTVIICQKGREDLYIKYNRFLYDHKVIVNDFSDIINSEIQEKLRELNTIFIPNRSFSVYVGYDNIECKFKIPMYGNRMILRAEERTEERNQYWLLEEASIKIPKKFNSPDEIDRLAIIKVQQKHKPIERAFFYAASAKEYYSKAEDLKRKDVIDDSGLSDARIEEYVLGQKFNANFQGWALTETFDNFDFVGFDDRKQTNLFGILNLPARDQLSVNVSIKNEEIGHYGLTMRESKKPMVYEAAARFRKTCEKKYPPGMIGLFALQGAVAYDPDDPDQKKLAFYIFDVSPRIPGCPCVGPTSPEMRRISLKYKSLLKRYRCERISAPMDLPLLEIKHASETGQLVNIVT